jgi:hypothetical protein
MMTNRTGKREREARNRQKRCMATVQIGGVSLTLKLGRKKCSALIRSSVCQGGTWDYLSPSHKLAPWAVPVVDSRKPTKKDEGEDYVS